MARKAQTGRRFAAIRPGSALVGLLATLCLLPATVGCAQDSTAVRAQEALWSGRYEEARRLYTDMSADGAGAVAYGLVETYLATGRYDEGVEAFDGLLRRNPDDARLRHARGRLLVELGRYEEAESDYRTALDQEPELWPAIVDAADLLSRTGRRGDAFRLYAHVLEQEQAGVLQMGTDLRAGARAAAALGRFRESNNIFRTAHRVSPRDPQTLYHWAELFREKFNEADAERTYQDALEVNDRHAPSLVGLARTVPAFEQQEDLARRALEVNPRHIAALTVLADLRILDGLYTEAEEAMDQALAINEASVPALARLATVQHLRGDSAAFRQTEARALEIDPRAVDFYLTLSENTARRFRYPDAAAFARRAVSLNPRHYQARATLGTALLRLGQPEEARRHLELAYEGDPFNLYAANTLTLIEEQQEFAVLESENVRLIVPEEERDVVGPLMLDLAEACYDSLSRRYPYEPEGRILVEAYHDADDFAVRVAGIPHRGLLGVSFGDVVAVQTPRARLGSDYNWARTLWHEVAHTMAIGTSRYHVPRWFTEGLSIYEEQRARPEWGREMDLTLLRAFEEDRLLPLEEIDRGFTRPTFRGQVQLSYYHAGRVISFMAEQYGFAAVVAVLEALGQGNMIEEAFRKGLGTSLADVDRGFREDLAAQRSRLERALADVAETPAEAEGDDRPEVRAMQRSGPFFTRLQEGAQKLAAQEYEEARAAYSAALDMYPDYTGEGNPYVGLAAVYRALEDDQQLIDILSRYLERADFGAEQARELAGLLAQRGAPDRAVEYLSRSLHVDPYDVETRERLAALLEGAGRYEEAIPERRAIVALDPVDRSEALYRLAVSLHENRQIAEAKRAVLQALELAPGYRDAQKLLLKCVDV